MLNKTYSKHFPMEKKVYLFVFLTIIPPSSLIHDKKNL